jgi:integrase
MKQINSHKDLTVTWDEARSKWQLNLRPLGMKPARPMFETKSKAFEAAKEAFDKWQSGGVEVSDVPDHSNITVGELLDLYLDKQLERAKDVDEKFGAASYANCKTSIDQFKTLVVLDMSFTKMKASLVGKDCVEAVWKAMRAKTAFRTADDRWLDLSRAFHLGFQRQFIEGNPCDLAERSRPDDTAKRIKNVIESVAKVSFETLQKIVEHTPDEHKLKIVFACRSGLRQSEQIALRVYDKKQPLEGGIDFNANKIYLRQAAKKGLTRGERYIGDPKTVAGIRNIPIDADLSEALKSYWDALPNRMKSERFLFPSEDGTMLDGTNLRERVLYRACKAAGMPRKEWPKWHELRHAFATHLLNGNKDWRRGMELMGHSDIRTTMIYTHVIEDPERDETEAAAMASSMPFNTNSKPNVAPDNVIKFKKVS